MKLTRFLIADNPMVEGAPSAIIHTVRPQAIIELMEGHVDGTDHQHYTYYNAKYTLSVRYIADADSVEKLLKRAWHWYIALMNFARK